MRIVALFLLLSLTMLGCSSAKQVQKTTTPVVKVDTTPVVVVPEKTADTKQADTSALNQAVFNKVIKNKINFNTFNAKVKVHYAGNEGEDDATAYIRLKKDSCLWLSLRGPLGIEGFRILITKDSVKVLDLLKKNVQFRGIDYLQEITGLPLDFATLEDLVVGNPVFIDRTIFSYKTNENNQLEILMGGKTFKNEVLLDNTDYKILNSKMDDLEVGRNRRSEITFKNYESKTGFLFSTVRQLFVSEQFALNINLDFKQYSFNQPVTFPFNIPGNYKKL